MLILMLNNPQKSRNGNGKTGAYERREDSSNRIVRQEIKDFLCAFCRLRIILLKWKIEIFLRVGRPLNTPNMPTSCFPPSNKSTKLKLHNFNPQNSI